MAVIKEGIVLNQDKTISFGNYELEEKFKVKDFIFNQNVYKMATYNKLTRLSKNDILVLETTPGTTLHNFFQSDLDTTFKIEGIGDTLVTVELLPNTTYSLFINDTKIDKILTNLSGKINFSLSLSKDAQNVKIVKA